MHYMILNVVQKHIHAAHVTSSTNHDNVIYLFIYSHGRALPPRL
jgi:hypothetical protein